MKNFVRENMNVVIGAVSGVVALIVTVIVLSVALYNAKQDAAQERYDHQMRMMKTVSYMNSKAAEALENQKSEILGTLASGNVAYDIINTNEGTVRLEKIGTQDSYTYEFVMLK